MSEPGTTGAQIGTHFDAAELLETADASLLDLVDHLLNHGVLLQAEAVIGLANIDLIYLRLTAMLCAADRVMPWVRRPDP